MNAAPPEAWNGKFRPLQPGGIHLWRCPLDLPDPAAFHPYLSADETARMERFKMPFLRTRYAVGRGALRVLSARYLDEKPGALSFTYGEHGKPALENRRLHFSLSHSGGLMAAAFTLDGPLGLDIEHISARLHARDIAERYFGEGERAEIETRDDGEYLRGFFRLWTAKEALMKATSLGFALELSKIEVGLDPLRVVSLDWDGPRDWTLHRVDPAGDFAGTLASRPGGQVERFTFAGGGGGTNDGQNAGGGFLFQE